MLAGIMNIIAHIYHQQAIVASSIFNPNPSERYPVNWTAYEILKGAPLDTESFVLGTAHRVEDMVFECKWRTVESCGSYNFTKIIADWGVCYSFNNDPVSPIEVRLPGASNGLKLQLNIEEDEYTYGENTGAGMRVCVDVTVQVWVPCEYQAS